MFFIFIKRSILLSFTLIFSIGSYMAVQRYLDNNHPTVYRTVSNVQIQKQTSNVKGLIHKLQSSLPEAKKVKTAIDQQYSNLIAEKNTLTKKEQSEQSIQRSLASK